LHPSGISSSFRFTLEEIFIFSLFGAFAGMSFKASFAVVCFLAHLGKGINFSFLIRIITKIQVFFLFFC
jgi:hypothetical protein